MIHLFGILLVALLGLASIFTTVSQDCPGLFLKAKVRPSVRRGILAGKGHAKIAVTLTSKGPVDNLEFQLNIPKGLSVERTAMRPSPKPYTSPNSVENADGTTVIYWLNIALTKRKGGKHRFRVKVKADECAPEMLEVDAFAYAVNGTGASCITPLAHSQIVKVRYSKSKKTATCAPSPAPTINPAQPFVLFGEGQQFSQGARQAPFQDRRLSVPSPIDMHKDIAALSHPQDRQLQSIDTANACYEYCSLNAGEETPFFFSWNTATNQCFCCVAVCTPFIFDPDSSVYEVVVAKTLQPTMQPTAAPTMQPTAAPTMQPTAAPTMQPTAAPTMAPTMQPTASPTMAPTMQPTASPTMAPTMQPTASPTMTPTAQPTAPTATWTQQSTAGTRGWDSIASSSDGTKLAAVVYNGSIWTSTDAGVSWTERDTAGTRNWYSIASSSDGMKLVAAIYGGQLSRSSDAGVSWAGVASSRNWNSVASSSDGTKLAAVVYGGSIWTSTDTGSTWTERLDEAPRDWYSIASSSDGLNLAAAVLAESIWTSADAGVSWTERTSSGSRDWYSIASSSDGMILAAVVNQGSIWRSTDTGVTWTEQVAPGTGNWFSIASSSNGTNRDILLDLTLPGGLPYSIIDRNLPPSCKVALSGLLGRHAQVTG
ncbi:hypothetical protein NSK_007493 [Nannochloropsis salina CCMP1776]|uniref:Photosynthesis system II assembly factor Ycf48/Hcf136-like domain-containing protein n=1 Tax=Nannochloropsis salina CCMP1776 TaxID=1027361 RepID=A0A4D9CSY8_9STRA|nr:hypothetical protein NSK_007493 [Nannochloropsis salina CCMP1776]|eukprot:TFJ81147.1 hypothetical protein NSK_007493 [Nannochloropsis salina CCMP1776]